ncbi:hypothetical protein A9Q84_00195 [Halobacteriovorax marinus]|uniref:Uncharacterized protein n=1 Tax=Halobacteriovorax marinus TaxID=97084 RepID=A0A1Y5FDF9_9BACT|nr:hypothetical protein A9Q84_00195 [Halobacteriovorax marinus]
MLFFTFQSFSFEANDPFVDESADATIKQSDCNEKYKDGDFCATEAWNRDLSKCKRELTNCTFYPEQNRQSLAFASDHKNIISDLQGKIFYLEKQNNYYRKKLKIRSNKISSKNTSNFIQEQCTNVKNYSSCQKTVKKHVEKITFRDRRLLCSNLNEAGYPNICTSL